MRIELRISKYLAVILMATVTSISACGDDDDSSAPANERSVFSFTNRCVSVETADAAGSSRFLVASNSEEAYAFTAEQPAAATPFFMKASRLGAYLFYDAARGFLVSDGTDLLREVELLSDVTLTDDDFESEAEWLLQPSERRPDLFRMQHRKSGLYLGGEGFVAEAANAAGIALREASGCAEFPEESTNSEGEITRKEFDDGTLFGFVDAHSHILANFAFGGGGIVHGAPFHPLGIEHALASCETYHRQDGRADLAGAAFNGEAGTNLDDIISLLTSGKTPNFNHFTNGYPEFTDWPNAPGSPTHQVQYYKWLERAYRGGLRLVVQHAVSNQILCDLITGSRIQRVRYSCNDMVAVDRQIEEVYNMQDYIDAQEGGPGEGWFRVVTTPAQAREVIRGGKLAVILGIETSNPFNCFLTPSAEFPACTEEDVIERLDDYYDRGIRALFPVHKYDNAFSAGDGHKSFIELGNFIQTGHFSNYTTDCDISAPTVFDRGRADFPGLIRPRENFLAPPPNDFSNFARSPLNTLLPFIDLLLEPGEPGVQDHCQATGLTALGEFLVDRMMHKGMIIEIDHMPRLSYKRAFEMLEANDYPPVGSHGLDNFGRVYALGGISTSGFGRCRAENETATTDDGFQARLQTIIDNGGFPGLGFGLDLNGFAGAAGPRFGENSVCGGRPQADPLTYPFTSYAGDVTFLEPKLGNRTIDFNTEGLVHVGMLPEIIEDVRRDGVSDEELEPLFKSAEGYIRMWEKAERRGAALRAR